MIAKYVRSDLSPLGGRKKGQFTEGRRTWSFLPTWCIGFQFISGGPKGTRRWQNCVGRLHSGESASPGLLRCLLLNSRGDPKLPDTGPENEARTFGTSSRRPSISRKEEGTLGFTISTVPGNNEFDPKRNSRSEIHFPKDFSQIGFACRNSGVVWRAGWQALRDDPQRHGKNQAHSPQSQSTGRALYDARPGHWAGISGDRAPPATGGFRSCAKNTHAEILAGETHRAILAGGRIFRDHV